MDWFSFCEDHEHTEYVQSATPPSTNISYLLFTMVFGAFVTLPHKEGNVIFATPIRPRGV